MGSGLSGLYHNTGGTGISLTNGTDYNTAGSGSVKNVTSVNKLDTHSVPETGVPNSVTQNLHDGVLFSERYYDNDGKAYLDIDYSNHGNSKTHPTAPHEHDIWFDDDGNMHRGKDKGIQK